MDSNDSKLLPFKLLSCFLVLHQATDGVRKSQEDQYWEEMWDIAKSAFAAQVDLLPMLGSHVNDGAKALRR